MDLWKKPRRKGGGINSDICGDIHLIKKKRGEGHLREGGMTISKSVSDRGLILGREKGK